ncbi:MAG: hypothetical protein H3C62_00410 [Gemmatimonadaceae bacterium]|nr:hypothetical protein [Gemmatimonadaceae bacterium]
MTNPSLPPDGRRPTRSSSLAGSAIADLGERTVGHSREKIEADRRALPRRRLMIAVVGASFAVGLPLLYLYSAKGTSRGPAAPLSTAPQVTGAIDAVPESLAVRTRTSVPTDSFPTIAFDTTAIVPLAATPSVSTPSPHDSATPGIGTATPRANTSTRSRTPATALPNPTPLPDGGDPPLLPPEGVPRGFSAPDLATRMAVPSGFSTVTSASASVTRRVSALAAGARTVGAGVVTTGTAAAGAAADAATSGVTASQTPTPGVRAAAVVLVGSPSATSGEPITVELSEALVDRGREILPVGTRGIGKGSLWDDGTGTPRLDLSFTHWVLPNGTVRQLSGRAYSPDDDRPGLVVPFSRQLARKGENLAANFGAAVAIGKLAEKLLPKPASGDQAIAQAITPPPQQEAIRDVWRMTQQELNLTRAPVAVLLRLEAGANLTVVFGMP